MILTYSSSLQFLFIYLFISSITILLNLSAEYSFATIILQDSVKVEQDPIRIDADTNTNKVYVTNYRSGSVSVIDGNTNKVLDNIELGIYPNEIVVNSNTSKIYVAHKIPIERPGYSAIKYISVIDGNTNKVLDNIELEQQPFDIVIDENTNMVVNPHTNRLYIVASINASSSLPDSDSGIDIPKGIVYIIDTKANKILSVLEVIAPRDIDINTSINRIYIINSLDKAVYSIDGYTNRLLNETMYIGNLPMGIAVNSNTGKIYVADSFDKSVYIFSEVS
jgi:YVTN family beta-propeller protein